MSGRLPSGAAGSSIAPYTRFAIRSPLGQSRPVSASSSSLA
jgi:hypothetical protein